MAFLFLPETPKKRCVCFIQRGTHEFTRVVHSDGSDEYVCTICGAPAEEAIASEEEYMVAWNVGNESKYLKEREHVPNTWGRLFRWKS